VSGLLGFGLPVPQGEVDAHAISENEFPCLLWRHAPFSIPLVQKDAQLDLVVQKPKVLGDLNFSIAGSKSAVGFQEDHGFRCRAGMTHLANMTEIVDPDADDLRGSVSFSCHGYPVHSFPSFRRRDIVMQPQRQSTQ
jgi:hypothetical protein